MSGFKPFLPGGTTIGYSYFNAPSETDTLGEIYFPKTSGSGSITLVINLSGSSSFASSSVENISSTGDCSTTGRILSSIAVSESSVDSLGTFSERMF